MNKLRGGALFVRPLYSLLNLANLIYRVIRWSRLQEQGCYELVFALMGPQRLLWDHKTGRKLLLGKKHLYFGFKMRQADIQKKIY